MSNPPLRVGEPWNNDEESQLLKEIKEGDSIRTIAEKHGRTMGAISSHLKIMAVKSYIVDKEPVEIISKETGLSTDVIMFQVAKKQGLLNKKGTEPLLVKSEVTLVDIMKELKEIRRMIESLS